MDDGVAVDDHRAVASCRRRPAGRRAPSGRSTQARRPGRRRPRRRAGRLCGPARSRRNRGDLRVVVDEVPRVSDSAPPAVTPGEAGLLLAERTGPAPPRPIAVLARRKRRRTRAIVADHAEATALGRFYTAPGWEPTAIDEPVVSGPPPLPIVDGEPGVLRAVKVFEVGPDQDPRGRRGEGPPQLGRQRRDAAPQVENGPGQAQRFQPFRAVLEQAQVHGESFREPEKEADSFAEDHSSYLPAASAA